MKTFKFTSIFGLSLLILVMAIGAADAATKSVTLAWDANSEPEVTGYKVYYSSSKTGQSNSVNVGSATTATINGLATGDTYYFVVTAYSANGLESAPSQQISHALAADPTFRFDALPLSQIAAPGAAVTLSVSASGSEPLTYQWHKDGNPIAGATGSTYTIPKISSASIGAYSVTVRDTASALSTPPAVVSSVLMKLPKTIAIEGVPGSGYAVTYKDELSRSNWSQLTNLSLTSNRMEWMDSTPSNVSQRFYRVTPAQ